MSDVINEFEIDFNTDDLRNRQDRRVAEHDGFVLPIYGPTGVFVPVASKPHHSKQPLPPAFVRALGIHMMQAESTTGMKWEDPDKHSTSVMWTLIIAAFVLACAVMPWVL
jgi:hypothetical protein